MQKQAQKLWQGLHEKELIQKSVAKEQRGSFLLFGHSANEMGAEKAIHYIETIRPDHILFIEPGTKGFFPEMLRIREYLLNEKFNVLYPCPTGDACPMANSTNDWCHQFIHVKQDPEIERLSQMMKKDRKLLPLIVHAYSKTYKLMEKNERIVRVFPEIKFSFEWDVCQGEKLDHYQVMKRGLSKGGLKLLESTLAGASLTASIDKELEQSKRVKPKRLNNHSFDT